MVGLLRLVPIYFVTHDDLLDVLAHHLGRVFSLRVEQRPPPFDPEQAFDQTRSQYASRTLLRALVETTPIEADRVLGITSVDLFVPVLTYVFGEAQLFGRAAIVSTHRLRPEAYGLPPSPPQLRARLIKEGIHELGHTFGLVHCIEPACVMHSSTYVEQIDLKSEGFCPACRREIRER